ncbi:MAG: UDP-N-acetylmuramoyl-L-alanine--D-glutamate ligase [Fidelibacterota bacterium]
MMDIGVRENLSLKGRHVTVIGAARSGISAAKLLMNIGANVFLSDRDPSAGGNEEVAELMRLGVTTEFGTHSPKVHQADLLVVSPGVPQDADIVLTASERGLPVVSEVELASWFTELPIVAVTGSNGKTTTATLLAQMFRQGDYTPFLAGNIGIPFSKTVTDLFDRKPRRGIHVLEISSFQMEHIHHFRPSVAVLLNLTADHLDRYSSLEHYAETKMKILDNMTHEDFVIYNKDDSFLADHIRTPATRIPFSLGKNPGGLFSVNETKIYDRDHEIVAYLRELGLPGRHNVSNFLAAATAGRTLLVPLKGIRHVMKTFRGVPHRLEHVRALDSIDFYNDSKATNVASVRVALDAFSRPVVLIMGGRDKGADFGELYPQISAAVREVIVLGEAADRIERSFSGLVPCHRVTSMEGAVSLARGHASPGDIVLLSPGCASFDMFDNFEQRGDMFRAAVNRLEGKT